MQLTAGKSALGTGWISTLPWFFREGEIHMLRIPLKSSATNNESTRHFGSLEDENCSTRGYDVLRAGLSMSLPASSSSMSRESAGRMSGPGETKKEPGRVAPQSQERSKHRKAPQRSNFLCSRRGLINPGCSLHCRAIVRGRIR